MVKELGSVFIPVLRNKVSKKKYLSTKQTYAKFLYL